MVAEMCFQSAYYRQDQKTACLDNVVNSVHIDACKRPAAHRVLPTGCIRLSNVNFLVADDQTQQQDDVVGLDTVCEQLPQTYC